MPRAPLTRSLAFVFLAACLAGMDVSRAQEQPAPLPSDKLFTSDVVQRLDLRINSSDWAKLQDNFRENTFYPADMVFDGQTVRNVGIRSRGGGSRNRNKPGLRVDFDRYATAQSFLGVKSIVLDNLSQDSSGVREIVAMRLFEKVGIPAPRESFVRLYINNAYVGVYGIIESIDKQFLKRVFGEIETNVQNDGYLFEYEWLDNWNFRYLGPDLREYKPRFNPKSHENASDAAKYDPIERLVRLANELHPERYVDGLSEYLDLRAFMRFVAAQSFVAENDGFLGYDGMNNFYLYRFEKTNRHVFIAWDNDNSFRGVDFPILFRQDDNVLMANAVRVPELRAHYGDALKDAVRATEAAVEGVDGMRWFEHETRRQLDRIRDAMREDPARPYSYEEHERAREEMIEFARGRAQNVREQLVRHGFGEVPRP
jgi:spore coat protein H